MRGAWSVAVRSARPGDREPVTRLLEDEGLASTFVPDEFLVAETGKLAATQAHASDRDAVDAPVAGCARLEPLPGGPFELASVAVQPELRGEGVGRALVREALARAAGPVQALAVEPEFFERLGFVPLEDPHEQLRTKAEACCADRDVTPLVWRPDR